jgi:hypothetical protein
MTKPSGHTQCPRYTRNPYLSNTNDMRDTQRTRHPNTSLNVARPSPTTSPRSILIPRNNIHHLLRLCHTPLSRAIRSIAAGALCEDSCTEQSQA